MTEQKNRKVHTHIHTPKKKWESIFGREPERESRRWENIQNRNDEENNNNAAASDASSWGDGKRTGKKKERMWGDLLAVHLSVFGSFLLGKTHSERVANDFLWEKVGGWTLLVACTFFFLLLRWERNMRCKGTPLRLFGCHLRSSYSIHLRSFHKADRLNVCRSLRDWPNDLIVIEPLQTEHSYTPTNIFSPTSHQRY